MHEEIKQKIGQKVFVSPTVKVVDLEKSRGSWFVEAGTGRSYLDCFSQFASQPLGWNHPKLLSQKDRLLNVAIHKLANPDTFCIDYANFVDTFKKHIPDFKHSFFICGGALAVENALKAAFDWKSKKLNWDDEKCNKLNVIHFQEAFHGRSGYTLSLTNNKTCNIKTKLFPKFPWTRVTNPKLCFPIDNTKASNIEAASISEIESALKKGNVAAIIIEPIQGEGGDNHFRAEFFRSVRDLADKYDAMLIFDEVQTGVGLTGKMWAYQHFNVVPDMLVFGKKMQVCGFCCTDRIDEVKDNVFTSASRINSTWGGNIIDMVRSQIILEIIDEDNLVENARVVGEYFLDQLKSLNVSNPRGRGLMLAIDLKSPEHRDEVLQRLSHNLLALPCGKQSIRFRPSLTFTKDEVNIAINYIKEALTSL